MTTAIVKARIEKGKEKRAIRAKRPDDQIKLVSGLPVGTWPSIPFEGLTFNLFITSRFSDLSLQIKSLIHDNSDVTFFCFSLFDLEC